MHYVSYEGDPVAQRDRALAWVKGECDTPHPQAVHRISGDDEIQAFEVDGRITADELHGLYAHLFEVAQSDSPLRSEEHTSERPSLMRNSYAGFCLKTNKNNKQKNITHDAA